MPKYRVVETLSGHREYSIEADSEEDAQAAVELADPIFEDVEPTGIIAIELEDDGEQ